MKIKIETRMTREYGLTISGTWVPYRCLEDLQAVHGLEGFEPGETFDKSIENALISEGLAHKSTRGSIFPTMPRFREFMDSIEFGEEE